MNILRNKKFLVTGGAGFIGSHFVDSLLKMGKDVTIFDNLSSGRHEFFQHNLNNSSFEFVKGDLLNKRQISDVFEKPFDAVIHLAANPNISLGVTDPTLDFKQTIITTFNLLLEMKKKKIKNIVYFSGSGVYGDIDSTFASESFGPLLPVSMYGASKLSAESLISAFAHLFDMNAWIFRPANIIGPRVTHGVVFDFINKLKKNKKKLLVLGDGFQNKSYLYISDVLSAVFIALTKTSKTINLLNLSSETYITVNAIADIILKKMNLYETKIIHTKGKIGWPGDVPIIKINNRQIKNLGWRPQFTSSKAVEKTVDKLLAL